MRTIDIKIFYINLFYNTDIVLYHDMDPNINSNNVPRLANSLQYFEPICYMKYSIIAKTS